MNKLLHLIVFCTLAGTLAACATITTPSAAQTSAAELLPALPTAVAPTQAMPSPTPIPSTQTALPPTETKVAGPLITLSQIHMLDATNGWGWGPNTDTTFRLLRTTDGGQTWMDVSPKPDLAGYYGSFFLNDQVAWVPYTDPVSNATGYMRTVDGGKTWKTMPTNDTLQMGQVQFTTINDGTVEVANVGAGNAYIVFYQSNDGGATWKPILLTSPSPEQSLPAGTIHLCNICGDQLYYDATRVVISHGTMANEPNGIFSLEISTDLGLHWKDIKLPLPDKKYAKGMLGPQSPTFFGQNGILPVNIMEYNTDGTLGYSALVFYTTSDGGQTWSVAPGILETNSMFDTVHVLSDQVAFVRCGKDLCSTTDGAHTWKTLPTSLDFDMANGGSEYVSQYAFTSPTDGWAVAGQDPATTVWKTTDGGLTWTKLAPTLAQ
jgi:photosystem II stability/assembly factor-like uncharacterized protein